MLYVNKKLYIIKLTDCPLCSFCETANETTLYVFCSSTLTGQVWS